jgi:uncharacterized protein YndB with AHSA1/START domain
MSESVHRPDGRRILAEIRTTATPEEVWMAWTDPAGICRWFADDARGEAKSGSNLVWTFRGFGEMTYPVLVADPPARLVLAGEIPGRGPFALEVLIRQTEGTTVVRLVNSGFLDGAEWDEEYEGVRSGWFGSLALLKQSLEHHRGAPRQAAMILRPAAAAPEELYRYFGEADRLAAWLTRTGALGDVGDRAALVFPDGSRLSGSVLSATGREKSVTWDEEDGSVLELKGFGAPGGRMVGVRLTTWGDAADRLARFEGLFTPAVERLAARLAPEPSLGGGPLRQG